MSSRFNNSGKQSMKKLVRWNYYRWNYCRRIWTPTASKRGRHIPIEWEQNCVIEGGDAQTLTCTLTKGQVLRTESSNMLYMENGIRMRTHSAGGLGSAVGRIITGSSLFVTDFTFELEEEEEEQAYTSFPTHYSDVRNVKSSGKVALAGSFPSRISFLKLADYEGEISCQKGAMLGE